MQVKTNRVGFKMSFYFVLVVTVLAGVATHSSEASSGLKEVSRGKRQALNVEEVQDPEDPKYKRLAKEAYKKYHAENLDGFFVLDITLTRVTRQTVAGYSYSLNYFVDRVDHTGYRDDNFCTSRVWEKPDHQMEFTTNCHQIEKQRRGKHQIAGGEEMRDPKDPEYKALAEESYKKYLEGDLSPPPKQAKDMVVTRATYQVVSGSLKRIEFIVTTIYNEILACHSEVWEQEWLNKKDIDVRCDLVV